MPVSEFSFTLEIIIDDLKSFGKNKEFLIESICADIFELKLKYSNVKHKQKYKPKTKCQIKGRGDQYEENSEVKVQSGRSVSFTANVLNLYLHMKNNPLEILLWNKNCPSHLLGSTQVQWSRNYLDYLIALYDGLEIDAVSNVENCTVFKKDTTELIANLKISVKLAHIKNSICKQLDEVKPEEDKANQFQKGIAVIRNTYENIKHEPILVDSGNKQSKTNANNNKMEISLSETNVAHNTQIEIATTETRSLSKIQKKYSFSDYIYGNTDHPIPKQMFYVGYMTSTKKESPNTREDQALVPVPCSGKCLEPPCEANKGALPIPDERYLIDYTNLGTECCAGSTAMEVEELMGTMKAKLTMGEKPCECTCECFFDLAKKTTTYSKLNNILDISKATPLGVTPESTRFEAQAKKAKDEVIFKKSSETVASIKKNIGKISKKSANEAPKPATKTKSKKAKKNKSKIVKPKIEEQGVEKTKLKYNNYGYSAPHIGHSHCALTSSPVPENMGWLWTADNIPGLEYRPKWKPGAANKQVVKLLKAAKHTDDGFNKKKRKILEDATKKTKNIPKPLLVVHQKDGQYEIIMELMKKFTKPRTLNQYPYEEKPPLIYTVGRTEEENRVRQRKKARERRRFERDARNFIQSSFKNMCKEICLKTYQDALELLPNAEDPKCPCFIPEFKQDEDSCSCSEDENLYKLGSETESGEWILEFTPPVAKYDPKYEKKKVQKVDHDTQYTYLDYRVKMFDSFGEPVPRFFKGPDGKTQCSDLGGFRGPGQKWLKINQDGIIGPDGKWAPMSFMMPSKEKVDISNGKFETDKGDWLTVGVDGYVNEKGIWQYYTRNKRNEPHIKKHVSRTPQHPAVKVVEPAVSVIQPAVKVKVLERTQAGGDKNENTRKNKSTAKQDNNTNANFSCFGDASPRQLTTMGITGHGNDKKLLMRTLSQMFAQGITFANTKSFVPRAPKNAKERQPDIKAYFEEREKCHHSVPSDKGIIAVDDLGNKTYFTLHSSKNWKHEERQQYLEEQGIRLSSYHVPCLHSFIGSELMKQQLRKRLFQLYGNEAETQSPE